ncbi:MAG TPA: multiheme c-type cytochrome [Polyangia bacterium]|nr:multiheme c-type cytochrome [Polyangia bacterium]
MRKTTDGVLVIGAGDDLSGLKVPAGQHKARARLVLAAYERMGMVVVGTGEHDTEVGLDLRHLPRQALVERAGLRIGVYALDLTRPEEAAQLGERARALRQKGAELVVAVLHGETERAEALLAPGGLGIDVALVSHRISRLRVQRAGETWVAEPTPEGKNLSILDLHVVGEGQGKGRLAFEDVGPGGQLAIQIADGEARKDDLGRRIAEAPFETRPLYQSQRDQVAEDVERAREALREQPPPPKGSWLENRHFPLGSQIPDDPGVAALLRGYKEEVAALPPAAPGAPAGPGATAGAAVDAAPDARFKGVSVCQGCHPAAVRQWRRTHHARAWADLVRLHQEKDGACAGCHITGGQARLRDVQCESCHGPGAAHAARPTQAGLIQRQPSEATCRACHASEQSPEWQFTSYRQAVLGPGHGQPAAAH